MTLIEAFRWCCLRATQAGLTASERSLLFAMLEMWNLAMRPSCGLEVETCKLRELSRLPERTFRAAAQSINNAHVGFHLKRQKGERLAVLHVVEDDLAAVSGGALMRARKENQRSEGLESVPKHAFKTENKEKREGAAIKADEPGASVVAEAIENGILAFGDGVVSVNGTEGTTQDDIRRVQENAAVASISGETGRDSGSGRSSIPDNRDLARFLLSH